MTAAGTHGTAPGAVDRSSPVPLWAQVHADVSRRVQAGAFSQAFPGEMALVAEYGVSRHTVREALRRLRADGVVVAERGRQPRLAGPAEIEQPLGAVYSLFAAVEAGGHVQHSLVRALRPTTDRDAAQRLGLPGTAPLVYLERLRLADDEPLALDRVWLPRELAAPLLAADFSRTSLYGELARRCGVRLTGGEERIRAAGPTPAQRRLLALPPGVAALDVERIGRVGDRPVEWRRTLVRGDRFVVSSRFSAREGYLLAVTADEAS